jgi:hypothetical protein
VTWDLTMQSFADEAIKLAKAKKPTEEQLKARRRLMIPLEGIAGLGAGYGLGTLVYRGMRKAPRIKELYKKPNALKRLRYLKPAGAVLGTGAALAMALRNRRMAQEREKVSGAAAKVLTHPAALLGGLGATTGALAAKKGERGKGALRGGAAGALLGAGIKHLPRVLSRSKRLAPHAKDYAWIAPSMVAAPVAAGIGKK